MTQAPASTHFTQNRRYPMTTFQLTVHVVPVPSESGPIPAASSLYRTVERQWPTVPRKGDLVSLGGSDSVVEEVMWVEFLSGKVVLHFTLHEDDRPDLVDLGFEPAPIQPAE